MFVSRILAPALLVLAAAPAWAVAGAPVPQPADFALFAVGVVGVLVGRRGAGRRRRVD